MAVSSCHEERCSCGCRSYLPHPLPPATEKLLSQAHRPSGLRTECHPSAARYPGSRLCRQRADTELRPPGALLLFQGGVNRRISAHFVVRSLRPTLHRKIRRIDPRHAALPYHNLAEDVAVHRNRAAKKFVLAFVRGCERRGQLHCQRLQRDFLLQLPESRFIHADSTQVETQHYILDVTPGLRFRRLKSIHVKWYRLRLNHLPRPLVERR